jgi:hypothetical protein
MRHAGQRKGEKNSMKRLRARRERCEAQGCIPKFRRLRVGERVAVTARTLPDGTYAAATVGDRAASPGFASVESSFGMTDAHGA